MSGRHHHERIDPERLIEAAEVALRAAREIAEHTKGAVPWPADLLGSPMQPAYMADFTRAELEEACEFLIRLGELTPAKTRSNRNPD